ncbi:MAG: FAD-dependent oxidoreductase [Chitinophagales bacterium]|nr:FAD-dependent oxidoreductase [Chitinophagales bacterium]
MLAALIKKRLKNYKIQVADIDASLEQKLRKSKSVAVIGSGLAGLSAATTLAERGFKVTVIEKSNYIGGKTGAWQHTFKDGYTVTIDHGFHAFFYQYYNLWNFIEKMQVKKFMRPIEEYLVLNHQKEKLSFKGIAKTPLLNILSLGWKGFYSFFEILRKPQSMEMAAFLNYSEDTTFKKYDKQSFAEFTGRLQLPKNLRLVFNSFSRAFFAEPQQMSMAELMKSFHFFYLSHDYGIDYDYFMGNYDDCLLKPTKEYLEKSGAVFFINEKVERIEKTMHGIRVNNSEFDYAVVAADVKGTKRIAQNSDWIKKETPQYYNQLNSLQHANGYAVYKLWIKGRIEETIPVFVITDRLKALDAVTVFDAFDAEAKKWADENNGTVLELHCYSVTPEFYDREKISKQFLAELYHYFPVLIEKEIVYEYLQLDNNFSSFQMNQHDSRPSYQSPLPQVKFAGDWVKLPIPAMLMEAAFSSGLFAANEILAQEKLQAAPIWSVPLNGLLHGN